MRWPEDYATWPLRDTSAPPRPRPERPPCPRRPTSDLAATVPCPGCGAAIPRLWFVERCAVCGTPSRDDV